MAHEFADWIRGLNGLANIGERLEQRGVSVRVDPPSHTDGSWFLDFFIGDVGAVIEWRLGTGYVVCRLPAAEHNAAVFGDPDEALSEVEKLLGLSEQLAQTAER